MLFLLTLTGCAAYEALFALLEDPPAPPCEQRTAWWEDADGDGLGSPAEVWISCEQPEGWVDASGDCDDADPTVSSGCDTGDTGADTDDTSDTSDTGETTDTGGDTGADTSDTGADTSDTSGTDADTSDTSDTSGTGADTSDTSGTGTDTSDTGDSGDAAARRTSPSR